MRWPISPLAKCSSFRSSEGRQRHCCEETLYVLSTRSNCPLVRGRTKGQGCWNSWGLLRLSGREISTDDKVEPLGQRNQLCERADPQLLHDVLAMPFHRTLGGAELGGDVLVELAAHDHAE